jgi:AraC-like DNA-binding protein
MSVAHSHDSPRSTGEPAYRPQPDVEQRVYSPQKIAALVAELDAQGVPAAAALDGSGLDLPKLGVASTRVSYRQLEIVCNNTLRLTRDPAIGLRAGERMHLTALGMYGYALLSSATFEAGIDFAFKYHRVIGPLCDFTSARDGGSVVYTCEPLLWHDPSDAIYRFASEFSFSIHLTVARDQLGASFNPSQLSLRYAAPAHADRYESLFRCPVRFGQPRNQMRYDATWLERPARLADSITNAAAREVCDRLLLDVNQTGGVSAEIRRMLVEHPGRFPNLEGMADALSMHPRALRRRLESERTTYRDVLAGVRMRLAIEYLRKTTMTNEEIASRLGYSDAANFRHAFIRWTHQAPSEFRGG